ncbi:MAG: energy transducer TonB [Chthoniobacterales bacterium]|jgi:TonB family protein
MTLKRRVVLTALALSFLGAARCNAQEPREISSKEAKALATATPLPDYPLLAREARYTGSGVFILNVQPSTGAVKSITVGRSTGHRILDWAAMNAFIRWRFKPNIVKKVKIPVTFTMNGWRY